MENIKPYTNTLFSVESPLCLSDFLGLLLLLAAMRILI
ncbi:hypothetical protein PCARR_a0297 [Pseudoalteromonas carrageenovora IAM 12662]|uniref:Uncharacterized protein n=1 Tax=Pseudoalteromonas carrageenovora IAM 12662 TaxID=1314868 RepID=A0ABR9EQA2_PSEVC|nr:hypothetical protein [Pseudoalteromonas carrageenovora IAM 12662]